MAEEPTSTLAEKSLSAAKSQLSKFTIGNLTAPLHQSKLMVRFGHLLTATSAIVAGILCAVGGDGVQLLENQAATAFFQIRGTEIAPPDIVILAIDDQSISIPEQYYKTDPQQYSYLKPLKSFPYQRAAYAQVITKLINAGARVVALDIVFDTSSSYGEADDRQLQAVLQKYGHKVALAAVYEDFRTHQGSFHQITQPLPMFGLGSVSIGAVNFPLEVDGKIHRLASEFSPTSTSDNVITTKIPSFEKAVLAAAKVNYSPPKGDRIYFWGTRETFTTIPLWYVFDSENWDTYLQQGQFFQNKIVLIGATAKLSNDYHPVAVSSRESMAGVEIHAHAIATLMANKSIATAIKSPLLRGLFVLLLVSSAAVIVTRKQQGIQRFLFSIAIAGVWGVISYSSFIYGKLMFPTVIPIVAITFTGLSYLGTEVAKEKINKHNLFLIFQKYKSSPVVQEIISQQEDLQDLIQKRDLALNGKILAGRYKIIKVLGAGGFSETYIAEDIQRPGNPQCVVKQLKPATTKQENLTLARRLFNAEAKTLEKLGTHNQIPQLLAYFEEDEEFYLVQEYILGHPLNQELISGKCISENLAIPLLKELLEILRFVHENGVIHRDIKPNNIIRRHSDWKLVLIDFGAVKEVSTQITESLDSTAFTIGIGTKGYAPSEQCFGRPKYNSDIYAVGMVAIKALTGIAPHELERNVDGEVKWVDQAIVSDDLAQIINKMVLDDYKQRYNSAFQVLEDLKKLPIYKDENIASAKDYTLDNLSVIDADAPTSPWPETL
ncbi:CHASE2 domain-containing protein [Sphaerospermopsis aphanizomenoides BCCUSP55]|uniref:serine/threonine-protein kinase n=1 Tax=Sphaerospermopsis aphanizomenoides TaxID=459663 RepID=UPI001905737D|nr:serine/threonine-protein kinase [Sphaerospermopsis aphanizomenoides]MBK1989284.1 CHASE2 domain-containing protein [Sphaerospermopsis aphanizomenoides BCCUSP55]